MGEAPCRRADHGGTPAASPGVSACISPATVYAIAVMIALAGLAAVAVVAHLR